MSPTKTTSAGSAINFRPRLVLQLAGAPREFALAPGQNTVGRGVANQIQLAHPSVSTAHCLITVEDFSVTIQDLGSTNGTQVGGVPVMEALLQDGQSLRLGEVDLTYHCGGVPAAQPALDGQAVRAGSVPVAGARVTAAPAPKSPPPTFVGAQSCKFHPKMVARFECPACGEFFCDACVAVRHGGGKFCRHCGTECAPVLAQFHPVMEKGFFARIPGAFAYPVRGAGVIVVIVGIALFGLLKAGVACLHYRSLRILIFGIILEIFSGGYLFTFLQSIVHSTSAEDRELPDLPGISNFVDDVVLPFFRLLGLVLLCFGPAIGLSIWAAVGHDSIVALVALLALGFGAVYFPMAFLSVAIHDSIAAANPLLVVPSMIKVLGSYLVCLLFIAVVLGLQYGGGLLLNGLFPEGLSTQSMKELFAFLASLAFLSFLSLYLLVIAVHLLGLLFVTRKETLGWLRNR